VKKLILLLPIILFACGKPHGNYQKAMQAAQTYLKTNDNSKIEFSPLDSVIDYPDDVLRKLALTKQQLMMKHDTLKNKTLYDSLTTAAKTKYYVIRYLNKQSNTNTWQMLVMDTTFKIKAQTGSTN
jgi:hypothetical protein